MKISIFALTTTVLFSAIAIAQTTAAAPFYGPKKTICTATINSDEEKQTFQKYLHPDYFQFVELVRGKSDINFLERACRNKNIKCDVTLISGHFGGGFTDNKEFFLPLEDIEKTSCRACPNVLGGADMVYLLGCNTLAGKNLDGRTPEEYYRVLVDEVGLEPAEARATVAVRYSAVGDSFNDRLRRVFKGSAVIGGFTSKAPLGEQIQPSLAGYFGSLVTGLKQDGVLEDWERRLISEAYYNELNRLKAGQANGENQMLFQSKKRIQSNFASIIGNGYIDVAGIQAGSTEEFVAQKMCLMNQSGKNKLQVIADIINTGDKTFVIQMLPYLLEISKKGDHMNSDQEAFFQSISQNQQLKDIMIGPKGIIKELAQAPEEQLKTVDLAVNLKWLTPAEQEQYYQAAAVYVWNNPGGFFENKKFLSLISTELQNVGMQQIKDSAFKGQGIWSLLRTNKSNQVVWLRWALNKLPISINYYANSYRAHANELATDKDLSEGWIKKHKTKMETARKATNGICSSLAKNSSIAVELSNLLSSNRSQLELLNAKDCLARIR